MEGRNHRLTLYLIFLVISIVSHFFITANSYNSFAIVFGVLEVIFITLIVIESYRRYKTKLGLIIGLIIILSLIAFQIDYVPAQEIIVKDVFDKPLKNIPIIVVDNVGKELLSLHAPPDVYRKAGLKEFYLTDSKGKVEINSRIFFGQRKAKKFRIGINSNYLYGKIDYESNKLYDEKSFNLEKNEDMEVFLPIIKIDYKECESITDNAKKSECLTYGLFYSAVTEKNPELCEIYGTNRMEFQTNHKYYLSRPFEVEFECLMFVQLISGGDSEICKDVENKETRSFKDQCNVVFSEWENNPESCDPSYKETCKERRLSLLSSTNSYLCERSKTNTLNYQNNEIRFLSTATQLYRDMFCVLN